MAHSGRGPSRGRLRTLLGLPAAASRARVHEAAQKLKGHIEGRLFSASSAAFARARLREVESLAQGLAAETGGARNSWLLTMGAFGLGIAAASAGFFYFAGSTESAAPLSDAPGQLSVAADPPGSTWSLFNAEDERLLGEYPADGGGREFAPGRYRVEVVHPECPDRWQREVQLESGTRSRYAPRLCEGEGEVVVESNVEAARVIVDGLDVGTSGPASHALGAGRHAIRVEKEGFEPFEGHIELVAGDRLELRADLAAAPPPVPGQAPDPGEASSLAPPPSAPRVASEMGAQGAGVSTRSRRERTGKGGSKSWHDAVKHQLVGDYDRNGSRSLDTREEIQAIPCPVLQNLEASYETGGLAVGMIHLYGFDGSGAPANTLGVTRSMRGYAYDRMKGCGLRTQR